jgi:SAM-dependent methyltransferase
MRYFEAHDNIYARRLAQGKEGWDEGVYDAFSLRECVLKWLACSPAAGDGARVLELGCGTGALACMLASRGFRMTGVDVSSSAIAFARGMASARKLHVRFVVADVGTWKAPAEGFDVVIDAHLLHCIVLPAERRQLLLRIADWLKPGGEIWTETMALREGFQDTPMRRMDDAGTVWTKVADPSGCVDSVRHAGEWWLPTRSIAASAEALLEEFAAARLDAIEWTLVQPPAPGHPGEFRARFRRHADAG